MLGIAISGHAFWNGSLVFVSYIGNGFNDILFFFVNLTWIFILITLLWTVGRFVIAAAMEDDA